jgi:D-glycero-D-manno-heptose 1,7-bisphosphate phosphatase
MNKPAVFLDRDGVLNRAIVRDGKPCAPIQLEEFQVLPEAEGACWRLKQAGFLLIVVTNQPEVARGRQTPERVDAMHALLRARVPVDDIRVCFHDSVDGCRCRKPQPGMLVDAAKDWEIELTESFIIGDRWVDIEAGFAASCRTVFIDRQYVEPLRRPPEYSASCLDDAVDWILTKA